MTTPIITLKDNTFISSIEIRNFTSIEALKVAVISNLTLLGFINEDVKAEWTQNTENNEDSGIHRLTIGNIFFGMHEISSSVVYMAMYCLCRLRRGGSAHSYYEENMDCLRIQLTNPDLNLSSMAECYAFEYPPIKINETDFTPLVVEELIVKDDELADEDADEEEDEEDDEDEDSEEVQLKDMTDDQINDYIEDAGVEPRDEIDEWTMAYTGGAILRYSYTTFNNATVSSQTVENHIIRCVSFQNATLKNCRFSRINFYECDFTDVKIKNTKFKRCKFFNCELPAYVQLEKNSLICSY